MRRTLVSALLASALYVPAFAEPLAITPNPAGPNDNAVAVPPQAAVQPAAKAQPQRYAQAAGSNLGGGFIQFLFGGAAREPAVPRPYQLTPDNQSYPPGYQPQPDQPQQASIANEPRGFEPSSQGDMGHPAVDPKFDRQLVSYKSNEKSGTIVIDTPNHFLFLVQEDGKAMRYGIGVGRPGFTWEGVKTITAKKEWPDWRPPNDMLKRRPDLPRYMAGGPENPLGARAMYLGSTVYRIHGSNEPWTIGGDVSSGCIRLRNADVIDLYGRVAVGAKVVVM